MSSFSSERSQDDHSPARRRSSTERRSRSRSPRRVRVKSKRIVIANIPYDLNWQKLKELFREQIGFTGFLQLFKKNGKPNGMGLMEFKTIEGAEKAIEKMHRFEIGDRKLVVREETARDAARIATMEVDTPLPSDSMNTSETVNSAPVGPIYTPQMLNQMGIEGPITDSVYVSNLDYSVTWQKLKDVFKLAGKITSSVIKTDSEGKSRGVGILKFSSPYEAVQAVSMFNNQILKDRPMRVKIDRQGTPATSDILYPPSRTGSSGILGSTAPLTSNPASTGQSSNLIAALLTLLGLKTTVDSNPQGGGIAEILRTLGGNTNVAGGLNALSSGQSNGSLGFGNHSLSNVSQSSGGNRLGSGQFTDEGLQQLISAAAAGGMSQSQIANVLSTLGLSQSSHLDQSGQLNGSNIVGRHGTAGGVVGGVVGDRDFDNSRFDSGNHLKYDTSGNYRLDSRSTVPMMRSEPAGNYVHGGRGRGEDVSQYDNSRWNATEKLIVKNIPFSLSANDVKRIFREVGEMSYFNLVTDNEGRSQGIAFIAYTNPDDIYRAIDLYDGKLFDGRRIRLHAE
ncbi:unnamed protein product [Trichobilharzia szidati]|nr:unnamed protein product [Trichobilharzia szidati]